MVRQYTKELVAGFYIVRFTKVISNRFDSTTFKRLYADLYKDFTKPVSRRRFYVSCCQGSPPPSEMGAAGKVPIIQEIRTLTARRFKALELTRKTNELDR